VRKVYNILRSLILSQWILHRSDGECNIKTRSQALARIADRTASSPAVFEISRYWP